MRGQSTPLPFGDVTFAFTDIVGSTALFHELGDAYLDVLHRHRALIVEPAEAAGGHLVKSEGDGLFLAFADATAALAALAEAQAALAAEPWSAGRAVAVRMGVHRGRATPDGGDYIALAVHQAARVAAAAHGGQILLTEAAATALADGAPPIQRLGRYRLRDFPEPIGLFQVGDGDFAAVRAVPAEAHNMTVPSTPIIGREEDLRRLRKQLSAHRLVTILGPGGSGKSRVAIELALEEASEREAGAWLVELETQSDDALVAVTVAHEIGAPPFPGRTPVDALVTEVGDRDVLLVLDACEGVVGGVASVVEALLAGCSRASVLVTSRTPLRVDGESVVRLAPLEVPPVDDPLPIASPAVRLFLDRATAGSADFDVGDDLSVVGEICRALDGMPLAIEIAAGRLAGETLASVASDVRSGEGVSGAVRSAHDRLGRSARAAFRRLACFRGGAPDDAVARVLGFGELDASDVADVISVLETRALVRRRRGAERGIALLEPVREVASALLAEAGEKDEVRGRHMAWARDVATAFRDDAIAGLADSAATPEVANLEAAMRTAVDEGDASAHTALVSALIGYWDARGQLDEAIVAYQETASLQEDPFFAAVARGRSASCLWRVGRVAEAQAIYDAELPALRAAGRDTDLVADLLSTYATLCLAQGRRDDALALTDEAKQLLTEKSPLGVRLSVLNAEGAARGTAGDHDAALACFEEVRARAHGTTLRGLEALAEMNIAATAGATGDRARAKEAGGRAVALLRERMMRAVPSALRLLGDVAVEEGDYLEAERLFTEALHLRRRLGDQAGIVYDTLSLAILAMRRRDHAEAAMQLALLCESPLFPRLRLAYVGAMDEAAKLAELVDDLPTAARLAARARAIAADGFPLRPVDQADHDALHERLHLALGDEAYDAAVVEAEAWDDPAGTAAIAALCLTVTAS